MRRFSFAVVLIVLALGCGSSLDNGADQAPAKLAVPAAAADAGRQPAADAGSTAPSRKIVYEATVEVIVDNLSAAGAKLEELIGQHKGILAQSKIRNVPDVPRSGTWRVRVPVERFADFVHQAAAIGETLNVTTDSQDITDKYFDVQLRIQSKQVQVERLQRIIKEQTGQLSDVLEAERELGRVTAELEQLKGSTRLWDNQTTLATVNVSLRERPQPVLAAAPLPFLRRIADTFANSLAAEIDFVQGLVIIIVALAPWAPFGALVGAGMWVMLRHSGRRRPTPMPAEGPPTDRGESRARP
jgi:hypothetical protein